MLDQAFAGGVLLVMEGMFLRQVVICLRAPSRFKAKHEEIQTAVEEGYSNTVTTQLARVLRAAHGLAGTPDPDTEGELPLQPFADVLSSGHVQGECDDLHETLRSAERCRSIETQSIWIQRAEAVALAVAMGTLVVLLWRPIMGEWLLTGAHLHVVSTVFVIAVVTAVILFVLAIVKDNALAKALVEHKPRNERIG